MARFQIKGKWYEASTYKEANEMAKSGAPPASDRPSSPRRASMTGGPSPIPIPFPFPTTSMAVPSTTSVSRANVISQPTSVATMAPVALDGANVVLYRADNRSPGEIKNFGAYKPWYGLRLDEIEELIQFVAGAKAWSACNLNSVKDFPPRGIDMSTSKPLPLPANPTCVPIAFHEWIIRSKDRGPTVSFAQSEEGTYPYGALNTTYIYKVVFPLKEVEREVAVPGARIPRNANTPKLCLDGDTLAQSSRVAVKGVFGNFEVSCLYSVPIDEIYTWKDTSKTIMAAAPTSLADTSIVAAAAKTLW